MAERFSWVIPDKLAGMERPGFAQKYESDVEFLKKMGIGVIVNLEEYTWNYEEFEAKHIPINDFRAPKLGDIEQFVKFVREKIAEGKRVVVHCYAGMGRTNLMLASFFVSEGMTPDDALDYVRERRPVFLVNDEQIESLRDYSAALSAEGGARE
ncbi:MAG: protein-tyrosine phosphatase family protein [Deltaproteobacteria bacterium]